MPYRVAVVGAVGAVGREILRALADREFPASQVTALASGRAVGAQVSFGERNLKVGAVERFDFASCDLALMAAAPAIAAAQAPRATSAGCQVIDTSGQFSLEPDVALVVPEVNPLSLARHTRRGIAASPHSTTIQLATVLKPLHDRFGVRRAVVTTFQAVSDLGREGMDELFTATKGSFVNDPAKSEQFTKPITFDLIPHIDRFLDDGQTREEWRLAVEMRKVLDPDVAIFATAVRVPVFIGHALSVSVELRDPANAGEARDLLRSAPGVVVQDTREDGGYTTPIDCVGEDAVYVSRVRRDPTVPNGLGFWCVTDNLRKGGALNAVQIAESLVGQGLLAERE